MSSKLSSYGREINSLDKEIDRLTDRLSALKTQKKERENLMIDYMGKKKVDKFMCDGKEFSMDKLKGKSPKSKIKPKKHRDTMSKELLQSLGVPNVDETWNQLEQIRKLREEE